MNCVADNCSVPRSKGRALCLTHYRAYRKAYDAKRYAVEDERNRHKSHMLNRRYGISFADYSALLTRQDGLCAVCRRPEQAVRRKTGTRLKLSVDHCHVTGKVRGLLCSKCNRGIGNFNNDPARLQAAASYLKGETA